MTKEEKDSHLRLARRRYAELGTKKEKGAFLDQYCAMAGCSRKTGIRRLSPGRRPRRRRGRRLATGGAERELLGRIWRLAGRPCAKLLKPVIAEWVGSMRRHGEALDEAVVARLLGMSPRTIDRRLGAMRPRGGGGRRRSLAEHRKEIPLKVGAWPEDAHTVAGWMEADSVALCGGNMGGSFSWAVTLTDTATQWTEVRVAWTNASEGVAGCLRRCMGCVPFAARGVNTDNGPEYISGVLDGCFTDIFPGAMRTRSRPYCKNDNAHVEQKNGHRARRLFGFGRYDVMAATAAMDELARLQSLFDNLYRPTMKLLGKTREGHRWRKVFEKVPKTPARRVLDDPTVPEWGKDRVRGLLEENDPGELLGKIGKARRRMLGILARAARKASEAGGPAGGGSALRAAPSGPPPARRTAGSPPAGATVTPRQAPPPASRLSVTNNMAQPRNRANKFR